MLVATAGHVDHGKTTLIRALTGVDTDRLPEEKKRGLTIDLGFAYLSTPSGDRIGFIDVPGHEKFIRNMAAGVGGVDIALLIVAADDGVMPQTREHIAILELLGVSRCIAVITRIDLVETSTVDRVRQQIIETLSDFTVEILTTAAVSAVSHAGIETLKNTLFQLAGNSSTPVPGHFRLAIDRSFSVKGAGTVVTGTVLAGSISEKDQIVVLPDNRAARIRSVHVNGSAAIAAKSGERAALNLANINASDVNRGHWVCNPALTVTSLCVDVRVHLLGEGKPTLKHWQQVQVHSGTAVFPARVALYEARQLSAGEREFAQLVLELPQHLLFADRFVIRDHGATRTIGGGIVIDPFSNRRRAHRKNRVPILKALLLRDHQQALCSAVLVAAAGINAEEFKLGRNLDEATYKRLSEIENIIEYTLPSKQIIFLDAELLQRIRASMAHEISSYHQKQPHSAGILPRVLGQLLGVHPDMLGVAIDLYTKDGTFERATEKRLRNNGFKPVLDSERQKLLNSLHTSLTSSTLKPPAASALADQLELSRDELENQISALVEHGSLIQVARNRYYHPEAMHQLAQMAHKLSQENPTDGFSAKNFAARSGIGRNLTIDVLEYFDRVGITKQHNRELKTRVTTGHEPEVDQAHVH